MNHTPEGALLALLDGELHGEERAHIERHLAGCRECAGLLAELRDAAAALEAALALLDRPAPLDAAERAMRARRVLGRAVWSRRALLRAAVLVLGFAAVGSAAIPDSPIRSWAAAAWRKGVDAIAGGEVEQAPRPAAAPAEAGVSILPHEGRVVIVVESPAPGVRARIRMVPGERVAVRALGAAATARFRTGPGRVEIVGPGTGELEVDVPASLAGAEIEVDGRTVVSKDGASFDVVGGRAAMQSSTEVVVELTGSAPAK
ncbi:MAG TPA: zf-HC2 domain-containing protein [Longimicrobiales bacterium]